MVNTTLHYYFDPLCGWCYAAAPLLAAAAGLPGLQLQLHGGGMMSGAASQPVTPALRNYVMPHDARIHALTGQPFGDAYFNGLLCDEQAVFDSTPPTLAILAAEEMGLGGLAMLHAIQHAHYAEGRKIAELATLQSLAVGLGADAAGFAAAMQAQAAGFEDYLADTRRQMAQFGLRGFPSLLLQTGGEYRRLDLSSWLGKPQAFAEWLQQSLPAVDADAQSAATFCTPEGCS